MSILVYAVSSRRKFFEDFAKEKGFDPLVANNWYLQAQDQILSLKVKKHLLI